MENCLDNKTEIEMAANTCSRDYIGLCKGYLSCLCELPQTGGLHRQPLMLKESPPTMPNHLWFRCA